MICNGNSQPLKIENDELRCKILERMHLNNLILNGIIETFKKNKNVSTNNKKL